ncbi:MAG: enoyl-CoA hydratase/isomerase family protein [Betaproteobacteria bacterium]|nr:enoyl-CoA hydratase/isomerase family protein [Betaproteobacteria bacterium]
MAAHETSNSGSKAAGSGVAAPAAATLAVRIDDGVAVVALARPEVHNAFDEVLIAELTATLKALDADAAVRVVVLAGQGRSFCAGADLGWMQRMAGYSHAENLADAGALAAMLATLDRMGKPTIARVHGAAYGGGVGLVACCDIAVAAEEATFALSEVKLGLIPATIGPYVVAAIGARQARRYFLTAERFTAAEALRIGLVHDVVPADAVDRRVAALIAALRAAGPRAQAEAKALVRAVSARPVDDAVIADTVARIAAVRASAEGREGVAAFLERRPAAWSAGNEE